MKRILALDGGGIRGVFTLQVLARIEAIFRAERQRPDLVLRDEFDFFAGTSTGAIIATSLAWGMPVQQIDRLYAEQGPQMFAPTAWYRRWKTKYRAQAIADLFRDRFCEDDEARTPATLGTEKLGAGDALKYVLIVMRNASTGSPWPVCNNPRAMYNDLAHPDCNLRIPLWKLLRASTAAPTYFPPEAIQMAAGSYLFMDGGITAFNNPALIAVLMATLPCYRIGWPSSIDKVMLVSIGTGGQSARLGKHEARRVNWLDQARYVAPALMASVTQEQDMICRVMGDCRFGAPLDSEIGDLVDSNLPRRQEKKFTYLRYNRQFAAEETLDLAAKHHLHFTLDNLALIPFLQDAGRQYAAEAVTREHFFPVS
jgi:patatin-like phospholipase/acyl hydrolase